MPIRLLLDLRVATSVTGIVLDSELESESESGPEDEEMMNTSSISTGIFSKICKSAGRGVESMDTSERRRTVCLSQIEAAVTISTTASLS
jgi:hypothetical protein